MDEQRRKGCRGRQKLERRRGSFDQGKIRRIRLPRPNIAMVMFTALLAVLFIATASGAAQPEGYPAKPIRLVVPLAPGGGNDLLARYISTHLSESLGQRVIVENRPGGGGIIGADHVAKSQADGYTVLVGTNTTNAVAASLYAKLPYDVQRDFVPITEIATAPAESSRSR